MTNYNLECLYLSIPSKYEDGIPIGFYKKSIADIIADADVFEVACVQEWFNRQILDSIGWSRTTELTADIIEEALMMFATHGIKPTECSYNEG